MRNHFFPRMRGPRLLEPQHTENILRVTDPRSNLRAEEHGLSLQMTNPTFTNLSAVQINETCRELAAHQNT